MFHVEQFGPLAQLVRVLAWHARGQEFESLMVHNKQINVPRGTFICFKYINSY